MNFLSTDRFSLFDKPCVRWMYIGVDAFNIKKNRMAINL